MIAFIRGKIHALLPTSVIIECQGIGYDIHISLNTYSDIQDQKEVELQTFLQIREDAHVLFGFSTLIEKEVFLHLISVNGVGPSTARTVLSYANPSELMQAIANADVNYIKTIKGIGPKTAERIVLELKDKMEKTAEGSVIGIPKGNRIADDALIALVTLGFPKPKVEKLIAQLIKEKTSITKVEDLVKEALKIL